MRLMIAAFWGSLVLGIAQEQGPTTTGIGYGSPEWMMVAPGQVVTVFATGIKTTLPLSGSQRRRIAAAVTPWPTSIYGISVRRGGCYCPSTP